ncbi:OmpA-OmpF porin [Candidatus Kinetoplastibacterium blastocrithidii TCC012E]|uniref:OmpA-OmpF porin n=1 Tax=Candidatus Kinetoplastidibacterium blastocrithidiae TCC012E TaxID=1208922 RepID=M1MDQ9_9PROT|nr:OmpA family protein [Candidatus Kinetoplastibacterium blastocrithidii]AFZ83737.1 OmpA-OmpF porin, OOP family [Candidatus Kinetoplastibacterium blastocrithidii (ex Strigomonas culicis)]AGF49860.1 OmpA-OmpF porin [Candidatus Kinetoplastibacterium blastocrithidii TCC012E]
MNKSSKLAMFIALATIASSGSAYAQKTDNCWHGSFGNIIKNGTNELCWKNNIVNTQDNFVNLSINRNKTETVVKKSIFFDFDSSSIKPESRILLDETIDYYKSKKNNIKKITSIGHSDSIGNELYNQKLSERRAVEAKKYLVENGIDSEKLEIHYYGSKKPIASNETSEGRSKNRRVDILITSEKNRS